MTIGTAVEKGAERAEVVRQEPMRRAPRYRPPVDILELPDELRVVADLPGAKAEDIDVNFERGVLTIHARVKQRQRDGTDYLLQEYGVGHYRRAFEVSETVDSARITADYEDGVLTLHLPKVEEAKPRRIEIRAN